MPRYKKERRAQLSYKVHRLMIPSRIFSLPFRRAYFAGTGMRTDAPSFSSSSIKT